MQDTIGVDISKDRLDAYALKAQEHRQFSNSRAGHRAFAAWAGREGSPLVVFEPTGAYHGQFERYLAAGKLPHNKVNPRQARRFAQAEGQLGKSDRADAASLARMGVAMALAADTPLPELFGDLRELLVARRALVKDRVAAKTRAQTARHGLIRRQIAARLRQVAQDLAALEQTIDERIGTNPELVRRLEVLISIPGIGRIAAVALVIEMPELGRIGGKQAAALAGLAPVTRRSGKWTGKARIGGGRAGLRRDLYMPALTAIRHNPQYHAKHAELDARGKPPKVIITAIMRKLVVLANALLRDNRTWSPTRP